jgi:F420-0:gamma-glutamyl ligase-like protein
MTKYRALAIVTKYWRPSEDYLEQIINAVNGKIENNDFVIISEKAISTALGNIVDEEKIKPSLSSRLIAEPWMRIVWGYFLGRLCHIREATLQRLREYPFEMGSRHKQVALQYGGLLQALMFGSEGGIDGSNLPFSYASLPLQHANVIAEKIRRHIMTNMGIDVCIVIVDTDKTYSFGNFHFTPRPRPIRGIHSGGGFLTYVVGRTLKFKRRATPLAIAGCQMAIGEVLRIAEFANRTRGFGAGRTVWDMAEMFKTGLDNVSWEMLETVKHKPIVIVKKAKREAQ